MDNTNTLPDVKAKITWINDDPTQNKRAAATIVIAKAFQVHGISIVSGPKGLFISMPQRQTKDKEFVEVAHPVTAEMRKAIYDAVLGAYSQTMAMANQYQQGFQADKGSVQGTSPTGGVTEGESSEDVESCAPIMGQNM